MTNTSVVLEASTPLSITTPKTVKACRARLRELTLAGGILRHWAERNALLDKIDFLTDEPDHYL
jgi:hypothetical protein